MVTQSIDGVSFRLVEYADLSFLSRWGKVFCAFDVTGSGCICFGLDSGTEKFFVKVAGAKTIHSYVEVPEAVDTLKHAVLLYETLKHPNLIRLIDTCEIDGFYIAVFEWVAGAGLFDYWNFNHYDKNHLQAPRDRFRQLPNGKKLTAFRVIFDFLAYVEQCGYMAIDFYDGSILYDFATDQTTICDIDFFRRLPTSNDMGENLFGTKRLKAPEEYKLNSIIDSVTNVFTLGALLFHFFGDYTDEEISLIYKNNCFFPCRLETWSLGYELYEIALKAVNPKRTERYASINEFRNTWNKGTSFLSQQSNF